MKTTDANYSNYQVYKEFNLKIWSPVLLPLLAIPLLVSMPQNFITSIELIALYGFGIAVLIHFVLIRVLPDVSKVITKSAMQFILGLSLITSTVGCSFVVLMLNSSLDSSSGEQRNSTIVFDHELKDQNINCFRIRHWDTQEPINEGNGSICDERNLLQHNDEVNLRVHPGFFGVPWISEIQVIKKVSSYR